jgi:subtilase family serine protease
MKLILRPQAAMLIAIILLAPLAACAGAAGPAGRGLPDLAFRPDSFRTIPVEPRVGDDTFVFITVENIGDADAVGKYVVSFWYNWTGDPATSVPLTPVENDADLGDLAAGASNECYLAMKTQAMDPGNYSITIVVDDENTIAESNESNNEVNLTLHLDPPVPLDLYIPPGGVSVEPASPFAGDNVTISAPVFNAGPGDARSVDVYFTLNDNLHPISARCMLTDMKSSTSKKATAVWVTKGLSPGTYDILVFVHPNWTVDWVPPDTNLSNNNASLTVTLGKPDVNLRLDSFLIEPARLRQGDDLNVTVTLTNTASRTVVDVPVALLLDEELAAQRQLELMNGSPGLLRMSLPTAVYSEGAHSLRLQAVNIDEERGFVVFVPRPDLAVMNMTVLPVLPGAGDVLSVTVKVANIGDVPSPACNLSLLVDDGTAPVAVAPIPPVPPDDAVQKTLRWNSSGFSPGSHSLRAVADSELVVDDSNRSNNAVIRDIDITGEVDLSVESQGMVPAAPRQGDSIVVPVTVRNLGTLRCNVASLTLKIKGRAVDRVNMTDIAAGASINSSLEWATAGFAPGNYSFEIVAAVGGGQGDSAPANNVLAGRLQLLPPVPRPDLRVTEIVMPERTLHAGQLLSLGIVVENAGDKDADATFLSITADSAGGRSVRLTGAPVPVPALPVGQSLTVNVTGDTSALAPGFYQLSATVDPANDLQESNETNNQMLGEIAVLEPLPPGPVLTVGSISVEGKLEAGQKVTIHALINNTGGADAQHLQVTFLVDGREAGTRTVGTLAANGSRSCALDWVAAAGNHTLNVTVSAEGGVEGSGQLPVSVSGAAGAGPWSAGAVGLVVALVLMLAAAVALLSRRIGNFGPPGRPPAEEE